MKRLYLLVACLILINACKKDDAEPTPTSDPPELCEKKKTDCIVATEVKTYTKEKVYTLYNKDGKVTKSYTTDPASNEYYRLVLNSYNNDGRLISSMTWVKAPGSEPGDSYVSQKKLIEYTYNGNSGTYILTQTDTILDDTTILVFTGEVTLNNNGDLISDKSFWSNGKPHKVITWTYNTKTNLLEKRNEITSDSLEQSTYTYYQEYTYDEEGKLISYSSLNSGRPGDKVNYGYDECDELIKATYSSRSLEITYFDHLYDDKGNLTYYTSSLDNLIKVEYTYYCP